MGGKRRSMEHFAPVNRDYIVSLLEKVDSREYGTTIRGSGLSPTEQRMRNKAVISLLYLSNRRISEIIGRKYVVDGVIIDDYKGVFCRHLRLATISDDDVLIMRSRILKKFKKGEPRIIWADTTMFKDDEPFISHILDWLQHRVGKEEFKRFLRMRRITVDSIKGIKDSPWNERFIKLSQSWIWQIFKQLDPDIVGSHWFRHVRLTHLSEYMNAYELRRIGRWETIEPAVSYVHGKFSKYAEACKKARGDI